MCRCSVSLTIEDTWATSQPATIEDRKARSRSVWSASARPSRKRNWAYAVRRTSRRVIRPPAKNGREKAVTDDVAMIVLSRSKKAAVLAMCSPSRLTVEGSGWRPHESGPTHADPTARARRGWGRRGRAGFVWTPAATLDGETRGGTHGQDGRLLRPGQDDHRDVVRDRLLAAVLRRRPDHPPRRPAHRVRPVPLPARPREGGHGRRRDDRLVQVE